MKTKQYKYLANYFIEIKPPINQAARALRLN